MNPSTELREFTPTAEVSHVELAAINFDQWILTVAMRAYSKPNQNVLGVFHIAFTSIVGFRVLDEGQMLSFPWPKLCGSSIVHRVPEMGWLSLEAKAGNLCLQDGAQEYIVITANECISVISYAAPYIAATESGLLLPIECEHG